MRNLIKKILKESDWDWVKEIPGTKEYGQEYRYFEIIACYGVDWETEECDDEYSHFVVIPKHDVDEIWDIPDVDFDYLAGPGDEGLGVIEYAIENQLISPREAEEIVMFQGVREIDGEIARLRLGESKSINESEWEWLGDTMVHGNYNGHPQGVVEIYSHDEIDKLCDIIDNYNGFPSTNDRHGLHKALEDTRVYLEFHSAQDNFDYGKPMLSVTFFVRKPPNGYGPNALKLGYFPHEANYDRIDTWLNRGLGHFIYDKGYEKYDNIEEFENLFKNYKKPNLMKESDWDWLENTREHANYNGHPQGIVKLYNHDEIDRLCDVIDDYNGLPDTTARHDLHRGLEFRRDELEQMSVEDGVDYGEAMLSVSFFVEKKNDQNSLTLGYWNYEVDEWDINEWFSYEGTYNKDYEMYDSIVQVENLFKNYQNPNLMKESDDDGLEWIRGAINEYPIKLDQWYVMDFCTGFDKYQDELYRKVYELRTSTGEDFDLRRNNEVNWFNNGIIAYEYNYKVRLHFKFTISPVFDELRIRAGWDSCQFEDPYMDDYITITKDDFLNSYLDI